MGRIVVFIMVVMLMVSCRTKYVPVTKTVTQTVEVHDSIIQVPLVPYHSEADKVFRAETVSDSVSIRYALKPDSSLLQNEYGFSKVTWDGEYLHHEFTIYPDAFVAATVPVTKESVVTQDPQIVEVEKKLTAWQSFWIRDGPAIAVINILLVIVLLFVILKRKS